MSVRHTNKDSDNRDAELEVKGVYNYGIKIQCPDCGSIFILNEHREYFCRNCDKIYSESEIRERCGL